MPLTALLLGTLLGAGAPNLTANATSATNATNTTVPFVVPWGCIPRLDIAYVSNCSVAYVPGANGTNSTNSTEGRQVNT